MPLLVIANPLLFERKSQWIGNFWVNKLDPKHPLHIIKLQYITINNVLLLVLLVVKMIQDLRKKNWTQYRTSIIIHLNLKCNINYQLLLLMDSNYILFVQL